MVVRRSAKVAKMNLRKPCGRLAHLRTQVIDFVRFAKVRNLICEGCEARGAKSLKSFTAKVRRFPPYTTYSGALLRRPLVYRVG
jgi:hypothetical protein